MYFKNQLFIFLFFIFCNDGCSKENLIEIDQKQYNNILLNKYIDIDQLKKILNVTFSKELINNIISQEDNSINLKLLNDLLQKHWYQNCERWKIKDFICNDINKLNEIIEICSKIFLIESKNKIIKIIKNKNIKIFIIFGATFKSILNRAIYLKNLLNELKIDDVKIILLTGFRKYNETIDGTKKEIFINLEKNKIECNQNEINNIEIRTEENLMEIIKKFIFPHSTILCEKNDDKLRRATTESTLEYFIKEKYLLNKKKYSNIIFISNEQYIPYQQSILDFVLNKNKINLNEIYYKVIGEEINSEIINISNNKNLYIANILNNIAMIVYNIYKISKLK